MRGGNLRHGISREIGVGAVTRVGRGRCTWGSYILCDRRLPSYVSRLKSSHSYLNILVYCVTNEDRLTPGDASAICVASGIKCTITFSTSCHSSRESFRL